MTLLDRVLGARASTVENPQYPLTSQVLIDIFRPRAASGVHVDEKSSLGMPAVWRAINLIAGTSASLPLGAYRKQDDVRLPVGGNSQAAKLLDNPHPDLTPFELWELIYGHLGLWGNGYLMKLRNQQGQISELWPIHPSRIRPGRASDMTKVYELDGERGYTDSKILHIPGFGYDGIAGLSPIQMARQGIGLAMAAETYGAKLFGSGSMHSGILQTDRRLTNDQADALKTRWQAKNGGLDNAHEIAVLDSGAKFQAMSMPPEDAQFIESRRFQIAEVARIFGIPPHMLMETDQSTSWGTGIEQQTIGFVKFTLRPWLTRVEQRLTAILKPEPVYARYAIEGLLRGDTATRYAAYSIGRQWGWLNADEIRAYEELPPLPDGKGQEYLTPLNMTGAGDQPANPANEGADDDG